MKPGTCMWSGCLWKVLSCRLPSDPRAQICSVPPSFLPWTPRFCLSPRLIIPRDTCLNGCFCSFRPCLPDLISYACQRVDMQTQLPGKRLREHLSKCEPFHTPVRQRTINSTHLETFIWGLERLPLFEVTE